MYLRKLKNKETGRIYLSIVHGYRTVDGKTRSKTIQSLGYLDELQKEYVDPIAHFEAVATEMNKKRQEESVPLTIDVDETMELDTNNRKNLGYAVLSDIYHELELDDFIKNRQRSRKFKFDCNSILRLLTFSRILYPSSKLNTFEHKDRYFEKFDFELHDVYRFLDFLIMKKEDLQIWLNDRIKMHYQRDTSLVYYDVTNYYFEVDRQDELRKKGVSKEHRPDPIVQMGLFVDNLGIPISYDLYPGNTVDTETFKPMLGELQRKYDLGRVIVVADKGITNSDNIWYTLSGKNGYVLSYSILGSTSAFKKYVLDEEGYRVEQDGFKIKSRLTPREINVTMQNGQKKKKTVHEKQVVFYNPKYAEKARKERAFVIEKARDLIKSPSKYNRATAKGATKYIKNIAFDKETGEILEKTVNILEFNEDLLKEQEKYDGYYAIVTSEYEESDSRILEIYRGLWKIEESFKVTKSDLAARPAFHWTEERIKAHFLSCFISLVVLCLFEHRMGDEFSSRTLIDTLKRASCSYLKENYYHFDFYDKTLKKIGDEFNIDFSRKYLPLSEIRKILATTKK